MRARTFRVRALATNGSGEGGWGIPMSERVAKTDQFPSLVATLRVNGGLVQVGG
ncbi:hypothetical protein YTPLAS18_22720 [Nitrospira sp.]|nr:hypothetical protein YTPLAS18_22720 [Nitrospira sp.]